MILLATDFDGTVAPIQDDPATVRIDERVRTFFDTLDRSRVDIAFLSGRELSDLRRRTEGIRAWRGGSHGLEISDPDDRIVHEPASSFPALDPTIGDLLARRGARLEPKKFGLAVHWRGIAIDDDDEAIRKFADWAEERGLKITRGRKVIEASVAGGGKARALAGIIERASPELASFAGDDLTDFEALEMIAARGWPAFFLRSPERREMPQGAKAIDSIESLIDDWRDLIQRRGAAFDDVSSR